MNTLLYNRKLISVNAIESVEFEDSESIKIITVSGEINRLYYGIEALASKYFKLIILFISSPGDSGMLDISGKEESSNG